ncbi:hypothetical protein CCHL11_02711 [Colletotrichum chlorophyti]|uniref:Uncharacterized protein n=1 Tax=Colletotrichum chlorophyti TaxID=708187 RepID=A0A1Q8S2U0_9PEZI|nr:hypothetical protein CCHL11_02711 [Colletotrichum chlorophyti]
MDALKNVVNNVPDWLQRLDELGDKIEERQTHLAALDLEKSAAKSIRNRGSTESLRPKDENAGPAPVTDELSTDASNAKPPANTEAPLQDESTPVKQPTSPSSGTPSALRKQTEGVMAKAQAHARAVVERQQRSDSVVSAEEGAPPQYRSRKKVNVYYDSFVQVFFSELVKFVSGSRNLMRKAKMAAKVAQIRRLAEVEVPDDGDASGDLTPDASAAAGTSDALPSLRYMSKRRMGPSARTSGRPHAGDGGQSLMNDSNPYDQLETHLEYVHHASERAAHQFLRNGDCSEDVRDIQRRLVQAKEVADKEMERIQREDPELLNAEVETNKHRTLRPTHMRREITAAKDGIPPVTSRRLEADGKLEADGTLEADTKTQITNTAVASVPKPLEADDAPIEADDEGVEDMDIALPPKLNYRSTRARG